MNLIEDLLSTTERLILRRLTIADLDNLYQLDRDSAVMRFINGGWPLSNEEIRQFLTNVLASYDREPYFGFWAIALRGSQEFAGWILVRDAREFKWAADYDLARPGEVEIGWRLLRSQWGRGYATEAARAVVACGFAERAIDTFVAWALADNRASVRVMEKLGMTLVREFAFSEKHFPTFSPEQRRGVKYALSYQQYVGA